MHLSVSDLLIVIRLKLAALVFKYKKPLILIIALLIGLLSHFILEYDTLSRIVKAEITLEVEEDTIMRFHSRNGIPTSAPANQIKAPGASIYAGGEKTFTLDIKNQIAPVLALEVHSSNVIKIKKIIFTSFHAKSISLNATELHNIIDKNNASITAVLNKNHLEISTFQPNTKIQFSAPIRFNKPALTVGLPLLLSFLSYVLLNAINPKSLNAFLIQDNQASKTKQHNYALDGIRGLAAIAVLFEHTWTPFLGMGRTGVWMFFILSGYLLSQPFVANPARILDGHYTTQYFIRRLKRIIPMYWFTVLIMFAFNGKTHELFSHFLFLKAEGHLWTIPQEMFFYLLLPLMMLMLYVLSKLPRIILLLGLILTTITFLFKPSLLPVNLYMLGKTTSPFIGWFMLGMTIAYLNPASSYWQRFLNPARIKLLSWFGIALLICILLISTHKLTTLVFSTSTIFPFAIGAEIGIACAVLLFLVVLLPSSKLAKILSHGLFRSVGIIGFSFYLLHPLIVKVIRELSLYYFNYPLSGLPMLLIAGVSTWLVASITYKLIERPFLTQRRA